MFRDVPAREVVLRFLKGREVGALVTFKELSELLGVADVRKSHRSSMKWARERAAEDHGVFTSSLEASGFLVVQAQLHDTRVPGPHQRPRGEMSAVLSGPVCKDEE